MPRHKEFQTVRTHAQYPKPGKVGGHLIREVIRFVRSQGTKLPIDSHILIATSGGADSVGLAHLLTHYGRRICSRDRITLLHLNHGWRAKESDQDEAFVKKLAKDWGVPVISQRLKPPESNGESWEEDAREKRKAVYRKLAVKHDALVLTAHQSDDLAETLLWRVLTGAAQTHGGGIGFRSGVEMRPFLSIRKGEILKYLEEEKRSCKEDSTNTSDRFLRGRMRKRLMPELEALFPKGVEHLTQLALQAQVSEQGKVFPDREYPTKKDELMAPLLFQAAGLRLRRAHWQSVIEKWVAKGARRGEIHLPGGWKLLYRVGRNSNPVCSDTLAPGVGAVTETWILERSKSPEY